MAGARHQREPAAPRARAQPARGAARALRRIVRAAPLGVLLVLAGPVRGRQGHGRRAAPRARARPLVLGLGDDTRAAPGRGRRRRLPLRRPATSSSALRDDGGLPRVVRGLRRPEGHAPGAVDEHLAAGDDVLLEIDVQGALAVRERVPGRAARVRAGRRRRRSSAAGSSSRGTDDPEAIERRLAAAEAEEAQAADRFDAVVVNDDAGSGRRRGRCYPGGSPYGTARVPPTPFTRARESPTWPNAAPRSWSPASRACSSGSTPSSRWSRSPRCGPARSTTTTTSSARASARSCRRRSPRCRASRCRSRSRRSRSARSRRVPLARGRRRGRRRRRPSAEPAAADGRRGRRRPGRADPWPTADALRGRRVVLGVSGGIAAYKAVEVCRRLVDAGAHVMPVLTDDAQRFVGALTFSALASEPARTSLFDGPEPIPHTRLGQTADLVVVAPATAKLLGKYAAGISDDLLTATLLATRAPVLVAPGDAHRDVGAPRGAGEPRDAARAAASTWSTPRRAASPAATSAPAASPIPSAIVAAAADVLARVGRPRRACACWSPRAAPASRSTRCASSATARRGRWATRSPRSPPGAAPRVTLVTTIGRPVAAGRRDRAGRDRRARCTTRCWPRAPTPTSS